jgi:hypothetical protein
MLSFQLTDNLHQPTDAWAKTITINGLPGTAAAYKKAPVNWNKITYAFSRNSKYYALFPTFTAALGLTNGRSRNINFIPDPLNDGAKSWIDNIFFMRGLNAEIDIDIYAFNPQTHQFELFISGIANIESIVVSAFKTNVEVISPIFVQDILNKDGVNFDIQNMVDSYSVDHAADNSWKPVALDSLRIYGMTTALFPGSNPNYVQAYAIRPFVLFERIIRLMTRQQNSFYSSFFALASDVDENGNQYGVDGPGAYDYITTGRFIRGYTYSDYKVGQGRLTFNSNSLYISGVNTNFGSASGQDNVLGTILKDQNNSIIGTVQSVIAPSGTNCLQLQSNVNYSGTLLTYTYSSDSDNATLILSFEKLFKSFSAIYCLGMTISQTSNGVNYVSIEQLNSFYDDHVIAIITNPKDIEITFGAEWKHNEIEIGYNKFQKNKDNAFGQIEYNNKITYSVPTKYVKKKLTLTSEIRTDTTGIQLCLDNLRGSAKNNAQNEMDNEIFIISSIIDGGVLRSRNDIGINVVNMPYGISISSGLHNLDKSPIRMAYNWGSWIKTNIDGYPTNVISFQFAEEITKLSTSIASAIPTFAQDCTDIPISNLASPLLSGFNMKFSSSFEINDILNLQQNPFGLIKVFDNINNIWRYGWIKEVSTHPIDKKPNWEIMICSSYVAPVQKVRKLLMLNGSYIKYINGGDIALINLN